MSSLRRAPDIRPRLCVGSLMDIPLGRYFKGKYGDNLLSGGYTNFTLTGGRGNSFKTTTEISKALIILERYKGTKFTLYDTEGTFQWSRIEDLAQRIGIDYEQMVEDGSINLTSISEYDGGELWQAMRDISIERDKSKRTLMVETPFLTRSGDVVKSLPIDIYFIDSLSDFEVGASLEQQDKKQIDDSSMQTDNMRSNLFKTRLITQAQGVSLRGGMTIVMTAHLGDEIKMDPYAPAKQQLVFLRKGLKFKNCPEKASFLSSVTWVVQGTQVKARPDKTLEYPKSSVGSVVGDTDLQELQLMTLRNKHGQAGQLFSLIVSQNEGLLPSLSEYDYLKSRKDKFGLEGPEGQAKEYRLSIYPDYLIKRKNIRDDVDTDIRLKRALEITSEMCQIYDYWLDFPKERKVTPKELYRKLKEDGHDWDVLLDTRGYWTYDHYNHPVKPLSTMDLLDMYAGEYMPWWYTKEQKAAIKLTDVKVKGAK